MDRGAKDKLVGSPGENGGRQDAQKDLHARTGRVETKRKTQKRLERRSRKRSSSAGSEKMERVGNRTKWRNTVRQAKSPQRVAVPMEEEDAEVTVLKTFQQKSNNPCILWLRPPIPNSIQNISMHLEIKCGRHELLFPFYPSRRNTINTINRHTTPICGAVAF